MARFYGSLQGGRGVATRTGTPSSGIEAHPRGWDVGIRVRGYVNDAGQDEFHVYATPGSNGYGMEELVAIVKYAPSNVGAYDPIESSISTCVPCRDRGGGHLL